MNRALIANCSPFITAGLGVLWSVGWIVAGVIVTWDSTGYDRWDILGYLGMSTLGFGFFAIGVVAGLALLVMSRRPHSQLSAKALGFGILLNILLSIILLVCLTKA